MTIISITFSLIILNLIWCYIKKDVFVILMMA